MRVLLIGSDSPLGRALANHLATLGRHELVCITRSAARWKSERQAKKAVLRPSAEVVVDVRLQAIADSGEELGELDQKRCQWVAKACERGKACYMLVSSARVFSGELDRLYNEEDKPDSVSELGQALAAGEQRAMQYCERHIILRLGRVFASDGTNLVTRMLGEMMRGENLMLDNNLRGSPVTAVDGARVVSALLDQISAGARLWGIYHYCSSDAATYYEFAESILAAASQFSEFGSEAVELQPAEPDMRRLNRSLECNKIRNNFAIKQQPWRKAIAEQVKLYFEDRSE